MNAHVHYRRKKLCRIPNCSKQKRFDDCNITHKNEMVTTKLMKCRRVKDTLMANRLWFVIVQLLKKTNYPLFELFNLYHMCLSTVSTTGKWTTASGIFVKFIFNSVYLVSLDNHHNECFPMTDPFFLTYWCVNSGTKIANRYLMVERTVV